MADQEYPDLSNLSFDELRAIRERYNGNQEMQNYLAPYEHEAYAREDVSGRPYMALPYLAMVPGYQIRKLITGEGRSQPSLAELSGGYRGVIRGLLDVLLR